MSRGISLKGRQCLRLVMRHNEIDEDSGFIYDLDDIDKIAPVSNDSELPKTFHRWNHVISGLQVPQPESNLQKWLYDRLRHAPRLAEDIAHYNRCGKNHPDRSYQFLWSCFRRVVESMEREHNRKLSTARHSAPAMVLSDDREDAEQSSFHTTQDVPTMVFASSKSKAPGPPPTVNMHLDSLTQADFEKMRETGVCMNFQRGRCKKGSNCEHAHTWYNPQSGGYSVAVSKAKPKGPRKKTPPPSKEELEARRTTYCPFKAKT